MNWNPETDAQFKQLLSKIPIFMRDVAQEKVSKRASAFAGEDDRSEINEKDLVRAFFEETPFGFHGLMKTDMDALGIDYTQYGFEK